MSEPMSEWKHDVSGNPILPGDLSHLADDAAPRFPAAQAPADVQAPPPVAMPSALAAAALPAAAAGPALPAPAQADPYPLEAPGIDDAFIQHLLRPVGSADDEPPPAASAKSGEPTWERVGITAKEAKALHARDGLLSAQQLDAIAELSSTPKGLKLVTKHDFVPAPQVLAFLDKPNWMAWEGDMSKIFRLQVVSELARADEVIQGRHKLEQTPAYLRLLAAQGAAGKKEIHAADAESWARTLALPAADEAGLAPAAEAQRERSANAIDIVRKLFVVLQSGLTYKAAADAPLEAWSAEVAVALSHGGRVTITIPKAVQEGHEGDFFDWLFGDQAHRQAAGLHKRTAGTHHISASGKEKKGIGAFFSAAFDRSYTHFGLDIPVGGLGNRDINGQVILPDGSHGHLYIGYRPPTTQSNGGLLIGCETSATGKKSVVGKKHDASAKSGEAGPTLGPKSAALTKETGGMVVDLAAMAAADDKWMDQLRKLEDDVRQGVVSARELVGNLGAGQPLPPDPALAAALAAPIGAPPAPDRLEIL